MAGKGMLVNDFDIGRLRKDLRMAEDELRARCIENLEYIGERCVEIARNNGTYKDHTGNLRSSIGYVVLEDGRPVSYGKEKTFGGDLAGHHGEEGPGAARAFLDSLAGQYTQGLVLIVCAGMNYATYVEAVYHKDVLTSAELLAESLAKKLFKGFTEG